MKHKFIKKYHTTTTVTPFIPATFTSRKLYQIKWQVPHAVQYRVCIICQENGRDVSQATFPRWSMSMKVVKQKMKYQSCPHVIYSTSLQWELLLTVFFKVSQEITTSFCECLREGVNWMVESKPTLCFVLMQCSCCRTPSADSGFSSSLFPTHFPPPLLHST